jgi:lysophospholipase L1-like esterase
MKWILIILSMLLIACSNQKDLELENETTLTYLALGDSYTIGESVEENERWPVQLKDSLKVRGVLLDTPEIIATTGWRTDQLKEAMSSKDRFDYDLVSLLIGVNNQYQGKSVESYRPEFEELLKLAIERAGGDKERVFVLSIPDYGYTPFGESNRERISSELDVYNSVNQEITNQYGIKYFNITGISRKGLVEPGLVASDGLHPSGDQYALWVKEILKDAEFIERLKMSAE